jgi:hypothetical protein
LLRKPASSTSFLVLAVRFRPLEWLWFGSERNRDPLPFPAKKAELARRAELARELAERARRPAEPLVNGDGDGVACDLYAQAVYWALSAHTFAATDPASVPLEAGALELPRLWQRANPELLFHAASDAEGLERIRSALWNKSFADFAELERSRQVELAGRLAAFVEKLLDPLRADGKRLARIWTVRLVRLGGLALVLFAVAMVVRLILEWNDERRDFAPRATWTLSSDANAGGCRSPAQACPEGPSFFFHTGLENDPSITFDLGREKGLSRVIVENRLDCCGERASPLVVEVSSDRKKWRQVARREGYFTTWRAKFPRLRARFVKIRVPGNSILHLSRVRILP